MGMSKSMGQVIRRLRKERNLTQEELARQLNISAQSISKWENDCSMPDIALIVPLATVFGVSTDVLFGMKNCNDDEEVNKIVRAACSHWKRPLTREHLLQQYNALQEGVKRYPNHTGLLMASLESGIALSYPENDVFDPDHAREIYEECIRQANIVISYSSNTTDVLRAHMILVLLHAAYGNFKQARFHAEKFPHRADMNIHLMQAYCAHWQKNYAAEAANCQNGILYSLHAVLDLLVHLAKTYQIRQQYEAEVQILEYAKDLVTLTVKNEPSVPPLHYLEAGDVYRLLAEAQLRLGREEEALSNLERMVHYDVEEMERFAKDPQWRSPLFRDVNLRFFFPFPSDPLQRLQTKLTSPGLASLREHPRYRALMDSVETGMKRNKEL
ncbi:MAG: helix-turn-helix transcriptional regulator [Clostridia bacterium]|nr:helix-turn-helix transcriptional regulator [Clostridia bacterium]